MPGDTAIAGECPDLTRGCSDFRYGAGDKHNNDDSGHDVGGSVRLGCVEEDLDEGIASRGCEDARDVAERKTKGDYHQEHQSEIEDDGTHNGAGEGNRGIFDFFGYRKSLVTVFGRAMQTYPCEWNSRSQP